MQKDEEVILCFEGTAQAIMVEQALTEKQFYVRVMPTPSSIRGGCGFCLRFLPEEFKCATAFLVEQGFPVTEAYLWESLDGAGVYRKIASISLEYGGMDVAGS